jgi:hypothetical protein
MIRRVLIACSLVWLAGCAQLSHVAAGDVTVKQRMVVTVDRPWNQFDRVAGDATPTWTQEGINVDTLRFHVGLKDGDLIAPTPSEPKGQKPLAFKATMQPNEVVALFEAYYSRGGSSFTLDKVTPATFIGQGGFMFEFSSVRKSDEVRLRGIGWGAVRNGELFVITYTAPRLAFFPRGVVSATAIAKSARVSG